MSELPDELQKIAAIAADLGLSADMRVKAMELLGRIGSREALLVLLELVANEKLVAEERDAALRQARVIIRSGR